MSWRCLSRAPFCPLRPALCADRESGFYLQGGGTRPTAGAGRPGGTRPTAVPTCCRRCWRRLAGPEVVNWTIRAEKTQVMVMVANRTVVESACSLVDQGAPLAPLPAPPAPPPCGANTCMPLPVPPLPPLCMAAARHCKRSDTLLHAPAASCSVRLPKDLALCRARHAVLLEGVVRPPRPLRPPRPPRPVWGCGGCGGGRARSAVRSRRGVVPPRHALPPRRALPPAGLLACRNSCEDCFVFVRWAPRSSFTYDRKFQQRPDDLWGWDEVMLIAAGIWCAPAAALGHGGGGGGGGDSPWTAPPRAVAPRAAWAAADAACKHSRLLPTPRRRPGTPTGRSLCPPTP